MEYRRIHISQEEKQILLRKLLTTEEVTPLRSDPKFFSKVVALGIHQEIGTIHDELSKFMFDEKTGLKIASDRFRSELIEYKNHIGVRIWAEGHDQLDPRVRGLRTLCHPELSFDRNGALPHLVIFPEVVIKIAALQGAELVSVKPWAINTIFGGFDPSRSYYEGNMWELINIDAVRYTKLLERKQIVFWGTHDLVSHIAGIEKSAWSTLQPLGEKARKLFEAYFSETSDPVPYTLVLPYALGMLLDDLAQPMNYASESRKHVVDILMTAIESKKIDPKANRYLLKYPPAIEKLILLARSNDNSKVQNEAHGVLADLIQELQQFSIAA